MEEYQMTDIHMHIIPQVDDGSFSMDMSKSMTVMAYLQGVRAIFATPHGGAFLSRGELVREAYESLKEEISHLPWKMDLFLGSEVRCETGNIHETLRQLEEGILPSMNGTRCVLTEFRTRITPQEALKIVSLLGREGWIPVIAHVERYAQLFEGDTVEQLVQSGCLLQINAYSLEEEAEETFARAQRLLLERKVSFLGSDAHRMNHRPPSVEKGLRYVYEHCPREYADAVAFGNAQRYLISRQGKEQSGLERE